MALILHAQNDFVYNERVVLRGHPGRMVLSLNVVTIVTYLAEGEEDIITNTTTDGSLLVEMESVMSLGEPQQIAIRALNGT